MPRDPDKNKLVTWRLVSFAYLQIGMLQAIAGFYAYFTVLHGFGFTPSHLMDLDRYRVFNEYLKNDVLRDAYYLWCFDLEITDRCIYLPNFHYDGTEVIGFAEKVPYFDDAAFSKWQNSGKEYVKLAKDYIVKISGEISGEDGVTLAQLNGKSEPVLDWLTFESDYWQSDPSEDQSNSIFNQFSEDSFHSVNYKNLVLFPNRRCYAEDYASYYRTEVNDAGKEVKLPNITPPFCNADDYEFKPRTRSYPDNLNSLFPIQTRTRVEALAMSNSAYFISIIIVQWADLMICKTRIRSLFEQGMTNTFMNYSLFFETILGAFLVYLPVSNQVTGTRPLRFTWWTAAVPFSIAIYIYDEIRKGWIRKNRLGWIHRNTYW
jgi:hypothetical protein